MDYNNPTRRKGRPPKFRGTECHTCIEQRQKCDGARPSCNNCQISGNVCGGYTVQLSWQPGFSTNRKPTKRSISRRSRFGVSTESLGARQLEFIEEYPRVVAHQNSSVPNAPSFLELAYPDLDHTEDQTLDAISPINGMTNVCMLNGNSNCVEYIEPVYSLLAADLPSTRHSELQASSQHSHPTIPASVLYNGPFERFESIFDRCRSSLFLVTILRSVC